MRRVVAVIVILAILAIAGAVAWQRYGGRLYTKYVLFRCDQAWRAVRDVEADVSAQYMSSELGFTVSGNARFKRPDAFRLELDQVIKTEMIGKGDTVWVYWPRLRAAIEVVFEKGSPVIGALHGRKADQWVKTLARDPRTRVKGKQAVNGRPCYLIDMPSTTNANAHTLLYVDARSFMPAKVVAFDETGTPTVTLALEKVKLNQKLPDADFELPQSRKLLVVRRVFNPKHPESLLLPPLRGQEKKAPTLDDWLGKMNDQLDRAFPRADVARGGAAGSAATSP